MTNTLQLRILVVDDEALIRWSLCELLRLHGHTVLEAASASDARAAIDDATPAFDVVLLDCRLPDSNDLTLLEEIRRRMPESAVGLMTAYVAWRVLSSAASPGRLPHDRRIRAAVAVRHACAAANITPIPTTSIHHRDRP